VAVTADHRAQVDELLADYRRSRDQLVSVHQRLASISESATSPDGLVTATVGSGGTLTGLSIADAAYRQHRPADLATLILETTAAAADRAAKLATEVVVPVLPAGTDPSALLRGTADLAPAELVPPVVPALADDDFENRTWMERR
jgi:DNA-binding protein YbaB